MPTEKIHFITGRLARAALENVLAKIAPKEKFEYSIQTLPISVAALLTPKWIAPRIDIPAGTTRICLPGYCDTDLTPIRAITDLPIDIGPKDLRRLPEYYGQTTEREGFGQWNIQIIAEINHAPRKSLSEILSSAETLRSDGADFIDVGCEPNSYWPGVDDCVAALKAEGHRVSIDSLNAKEISLAVKSGAELVLSVNGSNYRHAPDWGCEVVVIPDNIQDIDSMDGVIDFLSNKNVPFRIDPVLEPIGFGFANSLQRYLSTRRKWPTRR